LEYVQFQYIGHAVTKADKEVRNGKEVYILRVDDDDLLDDYKSIILLYDMKWKLIGEEKLTPPPAPAPTPAPVESNDKEKKPPAEKPDDMQVEVKPQAGTEKPRDTGGSGGDPTVTEPEIDEKPPEESSSTDPAV